jgi:GAF domain-containing protein
VTSRLEQRLREYANASTNDAPFVERLRELLREIERGFDGAERSRLMRLAEETFERHLELRGNTRRARDGLARLGADQRRLVRILEGLRARPEGETVH